MKTVEARPRRVPPLDRWCVSQRGTESLACSLDAHGADGEHGAIPRAVCGMGQGRDAIQLHAQWYSCHASGMEASSIPTSLFTSRERHSDACGHSQLRPYSWLLYAQPLPLALRGYTRGAGLAATGATPLYRNTVPIYCFCIPRAVRRTAHAGAEMAERAADFAHSHREV